MSSNTAFTDDVALVKQLAAINSGTNNTSGINEVGKLISDQFISLGFKLYRYHHAIAGDLLYLRSPKQLADKPKTLISGHLDTVLIRRAGF